MTNPYAPQWAQFKKETSNHQLTVLHDDGMYRHLLMTAPRTDIWYWEIVTWPGGLTVSGDIGDGYTFTHDVDMLAWLHCAHRDPYGDGSPGIRPDYWSESLAPSERDSVRAYSPAVFLRHVLRAITENALDETTMYRILAEANAVAEHRKAANEWIASHEHPALADAWEWDLTEWNHHWILACYALATTAAAWERHLAEKSRP